MAWQLTLSLLPDVYVVCRLPAGSPIPGWGQHGAFVSITRTDDELSIVCPQAGVPEGIQAEAGWRCLKVEGPFELDGAIGVMAALAVPLAEAGVSIFAVSTYDTDYLLLKDRQLAQAIQALTQAGHSMRRP